MCASLCVCMRAMCICVCIRVRESDCACVCPCICARALPGPGTGGRGPTTLDNVMCACDARVLAALGHEKMRTRGAGASSRAFSCSAALDNADFEGTDIPFDFCLSESPYASDAEREEARTRARF